MKDHLKRNKRKYIWGRDNRNEGKKRKQGRWKERQDIKMAQIQ